MVVSVRSLGLGGVAGYEVRAECFLSGGLPAFDIVGLPDTAVREARERVRAAVKNCGAKFPVSRITVNLAPAGQKKAGTVYDLFTYGAEIRSEQINLLPFSRTIDGTAYGLNILLFLPFGLLSPWFCDRMASWKRVCSASRFPAINETQNKTTQQKEQFHERQ